MPSLKLVVLAIRRLCTSYRKNSALEGKKNILLVLKLDLILVLRSHFLELWKSVGGSCPTFNCSVIESLTNLV